MQSLNDLIINALADLKADQVTVLDVTKLTSIMDYMIIASGNSNRHLKALAQKVQETARANRFPILGIEGEQTAEWILIDLGDVVVHVMLPETRSFYALEKLWSLPEI